MKSFRILLHTLLPCLIVTCAFAYETSCGNDGQNDDDDCENVGSNPINPQKANLIRKVTDLQTFGAAPIEFTRIYNSRTRNYTKPRWELGTQYTWQHNWQYELRESSTTDFGFPRLIVRYPEGKEYYFRAVDSSGEIRVSDANWGDRLYQTGTNQYVLRQPDGREYDFTKTGSGSDYQYLLNQVRNGTGWRWTLTYQLNSDGKYRLYRVTNNYGRYIQLSRIQGNNGYWQITSVSTNDGRSVSYGYSTWAPSSETVLDTVSYPGGEQAVYTWCGADSPTSGPPLLASADDPMQSGSGSRMKYTYNYTADYFIPPFGIVNGTILDERSLVTNSVIVSLPLGSGEYPKILEGNSIEITRKYGFGQLSEKADGEGRVTVYNRGLGGSGYLERITGNDGAETHFTRDFAGRVLTLTNALGGVRGHTYSSSGFLLMETDELGRTTTHTRDTNNRITRTDHPDGTYETFTYTGTGLLKTHRLRNGATESFTYDSTGNLVTHTDASGAAWTYTYFSNGLRASETNPRGYVSSYQYTWRGLLTRVTHPDSTYQQFAYSPYGKRTSVTNELGNTWTYTYSEFNQLATATDPLNRTTYYEYGREPGCSSCSYLPSLACIIQPSGKKIENTYDLSGKLIKQVVAADTSDAATITQSYNSAGRVAATINPLGKITTYAYDLLGRMTSQTDPLNHTTSWSYDAVGNLLTTTHPDATTAASTYDSMNRPLTTIDALGQTTTYTYHAGGSMASLADAKGNTYTFTVDNLSRRTRMTYPGGTYEQWSYDGAGNVVQYRTRSGVIMNCVFDSRNRDTSCDWSDSTPDVAKTYDAAGRLMSISNSIASSAYTYDAANQLLSESLTIVGLSGARAVSYTYDADGNRATLVYPDGTSVAYTYTARNQTASIVADGPPPLATFTYDAAGKRLTKTLENGVSSAYSYDDAGRLTFLLHAPSVETLSYTYDSMNRRTSEIRASAGARAFGYDAIGQLLEVGHGGGNATFSYDAVGNRIAVSGAAGAGSYTSNALNQYTNLSGLGVLTYDTKGNLAAGGGWSYTHNGDSRLISVSGASTASFGRDGRNREVKRTLNGVTTYRVYDGWNLIAEYNAVGALITQYIHGPQVDEILGKITTDGTTYPLEDGLGSTIAVTDGAGVVLERVFYTDGFGTPEFRDGQGNALSGTNTGTQFLFTGREWIASLGLYDYRNRTYSPSLGRFIETDPIRFSAGDVNLYRYVGNSPVNWVDYLGLTKFKCGIEKAPEYDKSGTVTGGTTFSWDAKFKDDACYKPSCCEVRQHISSDSVPLHEGFPTDMQPNEYYEDRDQNNKRYGRRTGPYSDSIPNGGDEYIGDEYHGRDTPEGWPEGTTFKFRLVVVDVCNGSKPIFTSKTLTVKF